MKGDSYLKCIKEELNEELFSNEGLPDLKIKEVCKLINNQDFKNNFEILILFETVYPGPFEPDLEEVSEIKFVSFDWMLNDIKENPDKYAGSFIKMVEGYQNESLRH